MKHCPSCKQDKEETAFSRTGQSFNGVVWRRSICSECVNTERRKKDKLKSRWRAASFQNRLL